MPELPEVETVARDLRPRLVGATIVGARCSWARTLRTARPDGVRGRPSPGATVAGRRAAGEAARHRAVRRRGADDPPEDDRPAVRRARRTRPRTRTSGSSSSSPTGASCASATSASSARSGCTGATRSTGELVAEVGGAAVFAAIGPEPLDRRVHGRATSGGGCGAGKGRLKPLLLDQSFLAGVGNIYADEALWRPGSTRCGPAASLRPPDERRLYEAIRRDPRRGGRAARLLDRRLHGARRRRLDAGAARTSTSGPASRARAAAGRSGGSSIGARSTHFCSWCQRLPAADRKGARRSCATMTGGDVAARPALDGAAAGEGSARADAATRPTPRRGRASPDRADEAGRRDPAGRGRAAVDGRRRSA